MKSSYIVISLLITVIITIACLIPFIKLNKRMPYEQVMRFNEFSDSSLPIDLSAVNTNIDSLNVEVTIIDARNEKYNATVTFNINDSIQVNSEMKVMALTKPHGDKDYFKLHSDLTDICKMIGSKGLLRFNPPINRKDIVIRVYGWGYQK